jgi:hypothetical protein
MAGTDTTTAASDVAAALRVTKGNPSAEELAALAAVLLMVRAVGPGEIRPPVALATWRRLERASIFEPPASWRRVA